MKTGGGRPPYDAVLMFRTLVLQAEFQLRDRRSFMRFAGPGLHDAVPDAKTVWLCCKQLKQTGASLGRR
jgi:hypothetical protein